MAALTEDRNTPSRANSLYGRAVKADAVIFAGSMVALAAGLAVPASATAGLVVDGRASARVDARGKPDGEEVIDVEKGTYRFANSAAADAITIADIGKSAYAADDQTVAKTDGGGTRPVAGKIADVDGVGVWVTFA